MSNIAKRSLLVGLTGCLLVMAACGGQDTTPPDQGASAGEDAEPAAKAAVAEPAAETASGSPSGPATGAGGIAGYLGKFPFDEVNGVSWNDNPTVLAAVRKTVADAAVREAILETPGPSAPIELVDGKVAAWSCEQHNCGFHQWLVMVDPKSGSADVCYYNEEQSGTDVRWFLAGGKIETRPGNCQPD